MNYTPNLNMPELVEGQAQGEITHNEALQLLDSLAGANGLIEDYTNTPPGSPGDGEMWLTKDAPTGVWNGHPYEFAIYQNSQWLFSTPRDKQMIHVKPGASVAAGFWQWDASTPGLVAIDGIQLADFLRQVERGIAASATHTQGEGPLTKTWSFVDTATGPNDVVTLPPIEIGKKFMVSNRTTVTIVVYPASGEYIDNLGINVPVSLPSGKHLVLRGYDSNGAGQMKWRSSLLLEVAVAQTFLGLSDTPATYVGQARKTVRVNAAQTGLEFIGPNKCCRFEIPAATTQYNNYAVYNQGANSSYSFGFLIPPDFGSLVSLRLIGSPQTGAQGSGKDIDLYSSYGADGESDTMHQESDTTSTYQIAATAQTWGYVDLSSVFTGLSAGDRCGVEVDHNAIGGSVNYMEIELVYIPQ